MDFFLLPTLNKYYNAKCINNRRSFTFENIRNILVTEIHNVLFI